MPARSIFSAALFVMTVVGFLLTVGVAVILGIASVVDAMGDAAGGSAMRWVGLGLGALLLIDLICLVLTLGVSQLAGGPPPTVAELEEPGEE